MDSDDDGSDEPRPLEDAPAVHVSTDPAALEDGEPGDGDGDVPLTIPSSPEEEGENSASGSNEAVSGSPPQSLARSMSAAECALGAADAAIAALHEEKEAKEKIDSEFLLSQDTSMAPDVIQEEQGEENEEEEENMENPTTEQEEMDKEMEHQIAKDKKEDLYPNPYARSAVTNKKKGSNKEDKQGDGQVLGSSSSNRKGDKNQDNMKNLEWLERQVVELRRRQAATILACKFRHGSWSFFVDLEIASNSFLTSEYFLIGSSLPSPQIVFILTRVYEDKVCNLLFGIPVWKEGW